MAGINLENTLEIIAHILDARSATNAQLAACKREIAIIQSQDHEP